MKRETKNLKTLVLISLLLAISIPASFGADYKTDTKEQTNTVAETTVIDQTAQSKVITGTVIDSEGGPVVGATVAIKGTTNATITDIDGHFSLRNVNEEDILLVTFIGYKEEEIPVQGRNSFVVMLKLKPVDVEDIVIVGFGTQKKESVVGAISTVKPADLQRVPVRSLTQVLAGNLSGLISLQSSGEPGKDDAQFWIRGISTFTGSQTPLVLVDGIERPLENVDPLEIESFSVLKDASATAVYGVRGANGVILINTKRGFDGKPKLEARVEQGFTSPTKRLKFVDAATRSMLFNEAVKNSNSSESLKYLDSEIEAMRTGSDPELYPNVDWQELLMRDISYSEKISVNFSGGGKNAKYYTAVSFYNQDGQYTVNPGDYSWVSPTIGAFGTNVNYKRYNFRTNVDMDVTKTTVVTVGLWGNIQENIEPQDGGSAAIYRDIINAAPNAFPAILKDGRYAGRIGLNNPYNLLTQKGYTSTTTNDLRANMSIEQDFSFLTPALKGLKWIVRYAYDAINYNNAIRARTINYFTPIGRNPVDNSLEVQEEDASSYMDYMNYSSSAWGNKTQYFEGSLNYEGKFKDKHDVGALFLFYTKNYKTNTAGDYLSSLPNKSLGISGRVTYAYSNRYLLELNLGYNGSENFPKGNRMGFFPAIAAGWVVSEEAFMKNQQLIDWFKLRASVGQVGNGDIPSTRFAYLGTIDSANGWGQYYAGWGLNYDKSASGLAESRLASEDVTWEVSTKYNLGVELGIFNGLRLNTDIFYENRDNIFIQPQTSIVTGYPVTIYQNLGVMENKGFEISGEYMKQLNKDLMVSLRGNYTFARNIIKEDKQFYAYDWQNRRGSRYGTLQGYRAMHLFTQDELDALPDYYTQFNLTKTQLQPGDIRYEDLNDDGKITETDMTWIGNPRTAPEIVYGFGATVSYKQFDVSFLCQGAANRSTYLSAAWYFQPFQADREPKYMGNVMTIFLDRWNENNQNPNAFSPRLSYGANVNNYKTSTWWLRDADYLRLKNLELGYTIPKDFSKKYHVQTARIYASAFNLLTLSKFYNDFWDPETGADAYPLQRQIFVGLNLTF
ncbi:MAG: TonB-dependent receptor [Dysgonamonadaceae bacterium]|jgi:TonB-linked SusC/RagA family outer membrane protein|nr:TonB-dependent receptor [Dysgonamonadaceae bacterium]